MEYSKIDNPNAYVTELISFSASGQSAYVNNQINKYYFTNDGGTSQIYITREDGSFVTTQSPLVSTSLTSWQVTKFSSSELNTLYSTFVNGTYFVNMTVYLKSDVIEWVHFNADWLSVQVKSSGGSPTLQSRTVTPSSSTQYITPQSRYDALS